MIDQHERPRQLIASSLDHALTSDEQLEMHRHVTDCAVCRETGLRLRLDAAALAESVLVVPPIRIRHEIERAVTIPPLDPSLLRVIRIAIAAALVLIVIVVLAIGVALLQPRPTTPTESGEPQPAGLRLPDRAW